jgi:ankyrin repeat protein
MNHLTYDQLLKLIDDDVNYIDEEGNTLLHEACFLGCIDEVMLLTNNKSINKENYRGQSPLQTACWKGNLEIVKFLLENGAYPNQKNRNGATPFHKACQEGHLEIVKIMIKRVDNIDQEDDDGWSPFHAACASGNINIVKLLLDESNNVINKISIINNKNKHGDTPLHTSCFSKDRIIIAEFLLKNGAYINEKNNKGETPLCRACYWGQFDAMNMLLNYGAEIEYNESGHITYYLKANKIPEKIYEKKVIKFFDEYIGGIIKPAKRD